MKIDLAGVWTLALDPMDRGIVERWWATFLPHPTGKLHLPGSLQAQGFGDEITLDTPWTGSIVDRSFFEDARYAPYRRSGAIKVPFWLQPERYYKGAAWYQRTVRIPEEWRGHRLVLRLERPHWQTNVWLDEQPLPPVEADVHFSAQEGLEHSAAGGHIDLLYPLGEDALTWDEFQPALYELTVDLEMRVSGDDAVWRDRRVLRFGLREVGVQGTQITFNGHPERVIRRFGFLPLHR